jgi:hypothetical protein
VLRRQELAVAAFRLGLRGGAVLNPSFRAVTRSVFAEQRKALAEEVAAFRSLAIEAANEAEADGLRPDQQALLAALQSSSSADEEGVRASLRLLDAFLPAVTHSLNEVAPSSHDWTWLKQGVRALRALGKLPAVVLGADGTIGSMEVTDPVLLVMGDVDDPETEVLFLNNLSGLSMLVKTTWAKLESGEHFPVEH